MDRVNALVTPFLKRLIYDLKIPDTPAHTFLFSTLPPNFLFSFHAVTTKYRAKAVSLGSKSIDLLYTSFFVF